MNKGVLSDGPAFFIDGDGWAFSCSWMKDGRPLSQERMYYGEGQKIPVTSNKDQTLVEGCIYQVANVDSNRHRQGYAKTFYESGNIEQGIFKDDKFIEGKRWEIDDKGTFDFY